MSDLENDIKNIIKQSYPHMRYANKTMGYVAKRLAREIMERIGKEKPASHGHRLSDLEDFKKS